MADAGEAVVLPMVMVVLPRALLELFPGAAAEAEVAAADVGQLIDALEAHHPGMRDRLCDSTPAIRRHLNIFVDGRRARLDTALRSGTVVYVMTAMSGG